MNIRLCWERRFKDGLCIKEYVENTHINFIKNTQFKKCFNVGRFARHSKSSYEVE